ncbi:MAG: thiamine phosphate synthase [Acetobacteraceae bacterium]|nr:thiamine phosphate synthase [Acetobacteraceae bacterium]
MDAKFRTWAAAVKARRKKRRAGRQGPGCAPLPPLWLFTDAERLPNPLPLAALLPKGLSGVILREPNAAVRAQLARALAPLCRARHIVLVIAQDARLALSLHAGLHLSRGEISLLGRKVRFRTSSAHNARELRRAYQAGACMAFLSPLFPTASHPGASALGPLKWAKLARNARLPLAALGGISRQNLRRVPRMAVAIGGIGSFAALAGLGSGKQAS